MQRAVELPGAARMAEEIVGELIGRPGIDLMLVGPIAELAESSTDRLSLDAIQGDVALLDWTQPDTMLGTLQSIGFQGSRAPHPHDPKVPVVPRGTRRVYAFDLTKFSAATDLIDAVLKLNADRQIRTIALGPPIAPASSGGQEPKRPPTPAADARTSETPQTPVSYDRTRRQSSESAESANEGGVAPVRRGVGAETDEDSIDLDRLIDELDQLDP